jgi:hypothetical protein
LAQDDDSHYAANVEIFTPRDADAWLARDCVRDDERKAKLDEQREA